MDTANSPAIEWVIGIARKVYRWAESGAMKGKDKAEKIISLLNQVKYSYLEPEDIKQMFIPKIVALAQELLKDVRTEEQRRWIKYFMEELEDLPRKLRVASSPQKVFRYRVGEIVSVSKHPTFQNLLITRVRTKDKELTVITNIKGVKTGERAIVVLLPPKEFGGVWSEAMFVKIGVNGPEDLKEEDIAPLAQYFFEITSS